MRLFDIDEFLKNLSKTKPDKWVDYGSEGYSIELIKKIINLEKPIISKEKIMRVVLDEEAYVPERAHEDDAGLDIRSREDKWVFKNSRAIFDTGVHVEIPKDHVGLLTSKSGLMGKGITSRGTIDCGFSGSIRVVLYNDGEEAYLVHKGDKISQLLVMPIERPTIEIVNKLEETERGDGGFGSTGR